MYTQDQIERVVNIDLYDYALKNLDAVREGNWARLKSNNSVCFKRGSSRYIDFSKQGKAGCGNLIDLLTNYYGETFLSVMNNEIGANPNQYKRSSTQYVSVFNLPDHDDSLKETIAYLTKTRGLPKAIVERLVKEDLLYQALVIHGERKYKNCVFVNDQRTYYEIHGTFSFGKSFHGNGRKEIDSYWSFSTGVGVSKVYICESSIDAISLAVIKNLDYENALYVSIGGVSNYKTIEKLIETYGKRCILAVDNDKAGQECRNKYSSLSAIVPRKKDWNEDLKDK